MINALRSLRHLDAWSPVGGTFLRGIEHVAFLEELCHQEEESDRLGIS